MITEWNLHLLRVVIEDGYPERHVGEVFSWFPCFWSRSPLDTSREQEKVAVALFDNYYRVNGQVLYRSDETGQEGCVLDFGLRAISEADSGSGNFLPDVCREGDYVSGTIRLELPLCTVLLPDYCIQSWRVNQIFANRADFTYYPGDEAAYQLEEVPSTDVIRTPSYVLRCSALPEV